MAPPVRRPAPGHRLGQAPHIARQRGATWLLPRPMPGDVGLTFPVPKGVFRQYHDGESATSVLLTGFTVSVDAVCEAE